MTPVRLEDCGDQLDVALYSRWCLQSASTTYAQLHTGSCLVEPFTLKPSPRWRRKDCEKTIERRDLVIRQRTERAKARMAKAS